jgi:hypothetical protein
MFCLTTATHSFKKCTYPFYLFCLSFLFIISYLMFLISSSLFLIPAYIGPSMERSTSHLSTASYMSIEVTQHNTTQHTHAKSHMHSCTCTVLINITLCSFNCCNLLHILPSTSLHYFNPSYPVRIFLFLSSTILSYRHQPHSLTRHPPPRTT